jgi:hypothetical protein
LDLLDRQIIKVFLEKEISLNAVLFKNFLWFIGEVYGMELGQVLLINEECRMTKKV